MEEFRGGGFIGIEPKPAKKGSDKSKYQFFPIPLFYIDEWGITPPDPQRPYLLYQKQINQDGDFMWGTTGKSYQSIEEAKKAAAEILAGQKQEPIFLDLEPGA